MPESSKDIRRREADALEEQEWLESLDDVIKRGGEERVHELLRALQRRAAEFGISLPYSANTPYINTIARSDQPRFPGHREIERRIKSIIRWNAMAMVVRANRDESGIGGHISTYASAATLYEVAFNHFFQGKDHPDGGDQIYFQGHASPGIYARAFLEGRLSQEQLENFRRELPPGGGLSSYPHPALMPDFWEFPTVSMGLGPIMAIYQARFNRYLEDRGLAERTGNVWAFLGDGETDEPEIARRDHPRRAREARQPDLRHQLQPAAARRPGARQRQDHPGTGGELPRRRLERDQGHLGRRLGPAAGTRRGRPAGQAHGRGRRRRVPEVQRRAGVLHPRALLRHATRELRAAGRAPDRRGAAPSCAAAGTTRRRSTPPTRPPSTTAGRPR